MHAFASIFMRIPTRRRGLRISKQTNAILNILALHKVSALERTFEAVNMNAHKHIRHFTAHESHIPLETILNLQFALLVISV